MARIKQPNSDRLYVTVPAQLVTLGEIAMCPAGMKKAPKTAMSLLVTEALQSYYEKMYGVSFLNLVNILESNPEISHVELISVCKDLQIAGTDEVVI
jgi:hypothetical protein